MEEIKLRVRENELKRAGLKEGVYFVELDENIEILKVVNRQTDIPVRIYSGNGSYYGDIPGDIVNKIKIEDGKELEIISPEDSNWGYIAMLVI
ncbi:hypothetical protein DRP05_07235 [Archaeoglobales archaeon]|nr:MAG: hypothetical protein DRP05_07235 [Archaeoglobales archaeon]